MFKRLVCLLTCLALCAFLAGDRLRPRPPAPVATTQPTPAGEPVPTPTLTPTPTPTPTPAPTPAPTPESSPPAESGGASAQELLAGMTVREKAAQVLLISCHAADLPEQAAALGAGGLCLYANYFEGKDARTVQDEIAALQAQAAVPLLISVDEEGGAVCRVSLNPALRAQPFLSPAVLYAEGGMARIQSDTVEKARLLRGLGINVNLAPVCDIPFQSSDFIYNRCFSTDAEEVAAYAALVTQTMNSEGMGSVLKHFPGYGGSADTHRGMAYDERPYEDFVQRDFLPFAAGIAAGADAVLVSHNVVSCMDDAFPASLSPEVHRILREEMGFTGVIVTDDLVMEAIEQFTGGENAAVQALLAGNDLICCADPQESVNAIVAAVEAGTLPEQALDDAALRVLRWKEKLGLLDAAA